MSDINDEWNLSLSVSVSYWSSLHLFTTEIITSYLMRFLIFWFVTSQKYLTIQNPIGDFKMLFLNNKTSYDTGVGLFWFLSKSIVFISFFYEILRLTYFFLTKTVTKGYILSHTVKETNQSTHLNFISLFFGQTFVSIQQQFHLLLTLLAFSTFQKRNIKSVGLF